MTKRFEIKAVCQQFLSNTECYMKKEPALKNSSAPTTRKFATNTNRSRSHAQAPC